MARKFGPFDNSVFYEVENRRLQRALAMGGTLGFASPTSANQGLVTAGSGAQLIIAAYADGALVDGMYVENPTTETVTITTNTTSTNPRIDSLVMRLDMSAKTIAPFQIVGTPGVSPQPPPLVQTGTVFDMPLCRYTLPGSASPQNPASIVDERRDCTGQLSCQFVASQPGSTIPANTLWGAGPFSSLLSRGGTFTAGTDQIIVPQSKIYQVTWTNTMDTDAGPRSFLQVVGGGRTFRMPMGGPAERVTTISAAVPITAGTALTFNLFSNHSTGPAGATSHGSIVALCDLP